MPTNKQLQEQIDQLTETVRLLGGDIHLPQQERGPPPNYIEHGSDRHAQFLGLIEVPKEDLEQAIETDKYVVYKCRESDRYFRLQDEIGLLRHYPGIDPEKAALVVLRQMVGSLESGKPKPPENAPTLRRAPRVMAR
jgi:hypothetical protein